MRRRHSVRHGCPVDVIVARSLARSFARFVDNVRALRFALHHPHPHPHHATTPSAPAAHSTNIAHWAKTMRYAQNVRTCARRDTNVARTPNTRTSRTLANNVLATPGPSPRLFCQPAARQLGLHMVPTYIFRIQPSSVVSSSRVIDRGC